MLEVNKLKIKINKQLILKGITFDVKEGEIIGILGKNGAGKTTLFNTIYNKSDERITLKKNKLEKSDVSYLETENYFYPYILGKEYLSFFNVNNLFLEKISNFFKLPLDKYIHEYSTGMKKKIAILASIVSDKKIVILDEPFNGLDFEAVENIYKILNLLKSENKIILISSHVIETLTNSCDKIYLLENGVLKKEYLKEDFKSLEKRIVLNENLENKSS